MRPSDKKRAEEYGPMSEMPEAFMQNFEKVLAANPAQDPANVAKAIAKLIATPYGTRPFRTTVDNMGMGGPIGEYNAMLSKITEGNYGNFGMGHLLKVKT